MLFTVEIVLERKYGVSELGVVGASRLVEYKGPAVCVCQGAVYQTIRP